MTGDDIHDDEVLTELKHYMRKSADASEKELVVEKVRVGSFSYDFIKRMDELRRNRECMIAIDMRGKVPYECKSYSFRNQVFWMDDITYDIFSRGLKENGGVYTVGLFETIMNASHTNRAIEEARRQALSQSDELYRFDDEMREQQDESEPFSVYLQGGKRPEVISLGFFRKRRDERLQYTTRVQIMADDMVLPLKTYDISRRGLQVYSRHPLDLAADMTVLVTFTDFNEEKGANLVNVQYRILGMERVKNDYRVRMMCTDPAIVRVESFIGKLMESELKHSRGRRRLDHEDEIETSESLLAEIYYSAATRVIPFIVYGDEHGRPNHVEIPVNQGNQDLLTVFSGSGGGHGVRNLFSSAIIETLLQRKELEGRASPLMMIYEDDGRPATVCDCDMKSDAEWLALAGLHVHKKNTRIFRLSARPPGRLDAAKLDFKTSRLKNKSREAASALVQRLDSVLAVGSMADVTDILAGYDFDNIAAAEGGLIREGDGLAKADSPNCGDIEACTVSMNHVESRVEDRYMVRVRVELDYNGQILHAESMDISTRGLCLDINSFDHLPESLKAGERVLVSFPTLQKKVQSRIKLKNMRYEIKNIHAGEQPRMGLYRLGSTASDDYSAFFRMLINQNREKMKLEMMDTIDAARARIYQTYVADNTATIPFFVTRGDDGERDVFVALPRSGNALSAFFEIEPGYHDFSAMSLPSRLLSLTSQLRRGNDTASLLLYMFRKQCPGRARFDIFVASSDDFDSESDRKRFIDEALRHEYCVVKLIAGRSVAPESVEVNTALERLHNRSPHHATRVRQMFEQVIAVGDIVDVTRQAI